MLQNFIDEKRNQRIMSITNIFPEKENNSLWDEIKNLKRDHWFKIQIPVSCGHT